ncbi:class II aldolase/adducin family protein [Parasphingorhabdus sp.]|uniref:class II aldolase/adducin family protein n=1 Tax=Parasphingorhabdus sp. TaxID=2709688 RepID=UPI003266EC7D
MDDAELKLRTELVDVMQEMDRQGLNHGTAGNASVRCGDGLLITPSGIPPQKLSPETIVLISLDGHYEGKIKPSSEWQMHTGLMKRPDVNAIVHCHSRFATTLACAQKSIPPLHYMTAVSGDGEIRLAPYASFGSAELASHIIETLDGRFACLMANHGQIAVASNLSMALMIANEIEVQASYYYGTLAIGGPQLLSDTEISEVLQRFMSYGQQKS